MAKTAGVLRNPSALAGLDGPRGRNVFPVVFPRILKRTEICLSKRQCGSADLQSLG